MSRAFPVTLRHVSKTFSSGYGQVINALRDVDLKVSAGDVVALRGPSGSGKSTFLHVVGAMDHPDSGSIVVGRTKVTALKGNDQAAYRRTVGFVFQRFHLLPTMTLVDNVVAPVLPYRTKFNAKKRARKLLTAVGLGERMNATPAKLSGGQQQRVAIARALINGPGLILADEPTGNLDSATGTQIMNLLVAINQQIGTTIVLATHDTSVAQRCHRTVNVRDGRLAGAD